YLGRSDTHHDAGGCNGRVTIYVDAAPSSAEPIQALADKWVEGNPTAVGKCISVDVHALQSANVEQILAAGGNAGSSGATPAVWIPDSSTWAARLNDDLAGSAGAEQVEIHAPIASSPVVFVSSPKVASTFITKPDWKAALAGAFPLTIPDP